MSINVQNQVAASTLRGQDAIVTLNGAQQPDLAGFSLGQRAQVESSAKTGYISEIDLYGYTFRIKPQYPSGDLSSLTTPGILGVGETIYTF